MKINRMLVVVGLSTLMVGAAFAQSPNQIPMGAGANISRPTPGTRTGGAMNPPPAVAPAPAASANKRAISQNCSRQADAKGLRGRARKAFREKCMRGGGR